jgi:hypothetical protein
VGLHGARILFAPHTSAAIDPEMEVEHRKFLPIGYGSFQSARATFMWKLGPNIPANGQVPDSTQNLQKLLNFLI